MKQNAEHRRFLKTPETNVFMTGYQFPEKLQLTKKDFITIDWFQNRLTSTIIFILSAYCKQCDLNAVEAFINKYKEFNYYLFFEAGEDLFKEVETRFHPVGVFKCKAGYLQNQLNFSLYPCTLGMNSLGQVITSGLFNDIEGIEAIQVPFIRTIYAK